MQLTKHTDLALRVLIYLARNPEDKATIGEIADTYKISKNHLVKVVYRLGQLNYIDTLKGKGGGIKIRKDPEKLFVGEIVRDFENSLEIIDCRKDNCPLMLNCLLKKALLKASNEFIKKLNEYSVSDIVKNLGDAQSIFPNSIIIQTDKASTR